MLSKANVLLPYLEQHLKLRFSILTEIASDVRLIVSIMQHLAPFSPLLTNNSHHPSNCRSHSNKPISSSLLIENFTFLI